MNAVELIMEITYSTGRAELAFSEVDTYMLALEITLEEAAAASTRPFERCKARALSWQESARFWYGRAVSLRCQLVNLPTHS
jgi:hypothetical protein